MENKKLMALPITDFNFHHKKMSGLISNMVESYNELSQAYKEFNDFVIKEAKWIKDNKENKQKTNKDL